MQCTSSVIHYVNDTENKHKNKLLDNNKETPLYMRDAFFMRDSIDRSRYSQLTTEEIDTYVGCFANHMAEWMKRNEENNYVKQYLREHGR